MSTSGLRKISWAKILIFQWITILILILALEILCYVLLPFVPKFSYSALSQMFTEPPAATAFGYAPPAPRPRDEWNDAYHLIPSAEIKYSPAAYGQYRNLPFSILVQSGNVEKVKADGTVIFRSEFTLDPWARRTSGGIKKTASQYLLFLGCSFTFGEGLGDQETLPAQTEQKLDQTAAYNYGISGASIGHLLFRLKTIEKSELPENTGWVIYPFLDQHLSRLMGRMSILGTGDFKNSPHFLFDADGQLITDGRFKNVWPWRTKIYPWLAQSHIVQFFGIDYPLRWSDEDYKFATEILSQIQNHAKENLNAKGLILIFLPGQKLTNELIPYLEKAKIRYLDYSQWDIKKLTVGPAYIPYDGHPTAEANKILGESIAHELSTNSVFL